MSSTYQTHTRQESEGGDTEFSFWGSSNTTTTSSENDCEQQPRGNEITIPNRKDFKFEEHSSIVSDPSLRSKAIAEGRKELMEKIMQDMPESSYELSFQDMVVEPEVPHQNETFSDNTLKQRSSSSEAQQQPQHKKMKTKNKNKKEKKKKKEKSNRPGQVLRVESMDSETFLLKMFFPTSLDWMKRGKVQSGRSKVSPRPSFQESSMKQVDKDKWRIKRFFSTEDGVGQNNGGSSNDKNRYVDRSFSFSNSCWPFFQYIKSKTKKMGG